MAPFHYFLPHSQLHWGHLGLCWAFACSLWSAGSAWTPAVFPVRKLEIIICNNPCWRWGLKAWFMTILCLMPSPHLGEPCVLCPVLTFCHVQTQSTSGWENTLPGLLPSFQSRGLTGTVHVHPGVWQNHSEGWFLQQAPAAVTSFSSFCPWCSSLQSWQRNLGTQQSWNTPLSAAAASLIPRRPGWALNVQKMEILLGQACQGIESENCIPNGVKCETRLEGEP